VSGLERERWRATAPRVRASVAHGSRRQQRGDPDRAGLGGKKDRVAGQHEDAAVRHLPAYRTVRFVRLRRAIGRTGLCVRLNRMGDRRHVVAGMRVRLDDEALEQDREQGRDEQGTAKREAVRAAGRHDGGALPALTTAGPHGQVDDTTLWYNMALPVDVDLAFRKHASSHRQT